MSPNEYKDLSKKFIIALEERLKPHGIMPRVIRQIQFGEMEILQILIGKEVYQLQNDGNESFWDFLGYIR